jgi:hypothetical protein
MASSQNRQSNEHGERGEVVATISRHGQSGGAADGWQSALLKACPQIRHQSAMSAGCKAALFERTHCIYELRTVQNRLRRPILIATFFLAYRRGRN